MAHDHKPLTVWTLQHKVQHNFVTVALPSGFIPDDDWEITGVCCQTLTPSAGSTDCGD